MSPYEMLRFWKAVKITAWSGSELTEAGIALKAKARKEGDTRPRYVAGRPCGNCRHRVAKVGDCASSYLAAGTRADTGSAASMVLGTQKAPVRASVGLREGTAQEAQHRGTCPHVMRIYASVDTVRPG